MYHYRIDPFVVHDSFCPIAMSNLRWLIGEVSDVKIVLSSAWRLGGEETWKTIHNNVSQVGIPKDIFIGTTPVLSSGVRGKEIQLWLEHNGETESDFVILDDDSDMGALSKHLVLVNNYHGLMYEDVMRAKNVLNGRFETLDSLTERIHKKVRNALGIKDDPQGETDDSTSIRQEH
jgi:hypothetical protein